MITAVVPVFEDTKLETIIEAAVERKLVGMFKDAVEKARTGSYTPNNQAVEQAVAKSIFPGVANVVLDAKLGELAESQDFSRGVAWQFMNSPTLTMPVTRIARQQTEIAGAREADFITKSKNAERRHKTSLEDKTPPSPITTRSPELSESSEDVEKRNRSNVHTRIVVTVQAAVSASTDILTRRLTTVRRLKLPKEWKYWSRSTRISVTPLISGSIAWTIRHKNTTDIFPTKFLSRPRGYRSRCIRQPSNQDPIFTPSSLHNFKNACGSIGIYEEAAMWQFQNFFKERAKAALIHRVCTTRKDDSQSEGRLTTYCQVVCYLLATYATDNVIAEAKANITSFYQSENKSATRYAQLLWEKTPRCGQVYK